MPGRLAAVFRGPPVRLTVTLAAQACEVGQPIAARLAVAALTDVEIREVRACLVQRIWRHRPQVVAGPWGAAPSSTAPHAVVAGAWSAAPEMAGPLASGTSAEQDIVLNNWTSVPSGGLPPGRRIEYAVRAEAWLAGYRARAEAPVRLLSGPSLYREVEGAEFRRRSRRCDIDLVGPVLRARPGQTVGGSLRVTPHQPMRARAVAVFLVRRQSMAVNWRVMATRSLARHVDLAGPRDFGFALPVPLDAPTIITPHQSFWVRWYLEAMVRYGVLAADRTTVEINVFTAPP